MSVTLLKGGLLGPRDRTRRHTRVGCQRSTLAEEARNLVLAALLRVLQRRHAGAIGDVPVGARRQQDLDDFL
ncbi:MAG TPA: hypothetical protein PLB86_13945, partial [Dermatophilaceae bacterium]|nr:hypothetical protein [Dermatophilaceae bacterium]